MTLDELAKLRRSLLTKKFSDERPCPALCAVENTELEQPKLGNTDQVKIKDVHTTGLRIHQPLVV